MPTPAETVTSAFALAQQYADDAKTQMSTFTNAFAGTIYQTPTVDITWAPIESPVAIPPPTRPAALDELEPEFDWDQDGTIALTKPVAPDLTAPTVTIDDFTEVAPTVTLPVAPTVTYGAAPTVPAVAAVTVPTAPTIATFTVPTLLALTAPTFAGVDIEAALQTPLETMPTLALVAPTSYTYTPGTKYASTLLTNMQSLLVNRLAGGTGLDATVEAAIWDRARDRETKTAQGNIDDVMRSSESLGFKLPSGVTAQQLREAQVNLYNRTGDLSREIAIKQADLEQENLKQTIAAGVQLESKLIDYAWQLEELAFKSAVALAENAVAVYNAQVAKFGADVQAYQAYASAYKVIIDAQLALVAELEARIKLEQAKADINSALIGQYKAQIEAEMTKVEIYKAQVSGAQTLIQLEQAKVQAAGEQIKAYVAGVNAETSKVEAYKAQIEAAKTGVELYKVKADAFSAKVQGQAEKARAQLAYYTARITAYSAEWEGWRARVAGEGERFRALSAKSSAMVDGYRADVAAFEASAGQDIKRWEVAIKQYDAQASYTMQGQKLNAEIIQGNRAALMEASKVGAQTYAQLTSAAYGLFHASAGVSGNSGTTVSYSYSNDTSSAPSSLTSI